MSKFCGEIVAGAFAALRAAHIRSSWLSGNCKTNCCNFNDNLIEVSGNVLFLATNLLIVSVLLKVRSTCLCLWILDEKEPGINFIDTFNPTLKKTPLLIDIILAIYFCIYVDVKSRTFILMVEFWGN